MEMIIYGLTLVSFFSGTSTCVSATLIKDVRRTSRAPHHPIPVSNRHTASHGFSDVIYGLEKSKQATKTQRNANKITDLPTYSKQEMSTADEPTKTDISKIASSKTIYRNPTKRSGWSLPGYSLPYKHNKMNDASIQQVVDCNTNNDDNDNDNVKTRKHHDEAENQAIINEECQLKPTMHVATSGARIATKIEERKHQNSEMTAKKQQKTALTQDGRPKCSQKHYFHRKRLQKLVWPSFEKVEISGTKSTQNPTAISKILVTTSF